MNAGNWMNEYNATEMNESRWLNERTQVWQVEGLKRVFTGTSAMREQDVSQIESVLAAYALELSRC